LHHEGINYVIDVPKLGVLSRRNPHRLPQSVKRMVDARSRTILHLMQTRPWDMMMAVFVATDRVQHCYWPEGEVPLENPDWSPIRSLYQQIDLFFSDVLELIDENTTVLVVSDHGFGPAHSAMRCLNLLFAQLGLLRYYQGRSRLEGRFLENLLFYGRRIIPPRFQNPLSRALPRLHLHAIMESKFLGIEWSKTQVFAEPYEGRIFINLQGREPEGIVSAKEHNSLCERLRDILLKLTDPGSGAPVVRAIYRPEDLYHGPYAKNTADLVVEWDEEILRDALCYHGEGKPIIVQTSKRMGGSSQWRGSHRSKGIFIAFGPHIKQGATITNATLYDITPTILYLQEHPIPKDMDGSVLTDIFNNDYLSHHPIKQSESSDIKWEGDTGAAALDAEETRKIEERLRGLGYIE
jgi:predicted AlkP superfamily phosphohydrolase/phosphomutase